MREEQGLYYIQTQFRISKKKKRKKSGEPRPGIMVSANCRQAT